MRFSDVVSIISGGTPKTTTPSYWGGTIPWLSIKDFVSVNSYVYSTEKTITEEGLNNSPCNLLKKDDIIISARGTVGQIALIPYDMAFNQSCYGLRSNGKVSSKYLFYWLKGNKDKLLTNVHGAVFDTITKNTFDNIEIELPGPSIERHIVDILGSIDDKIEYSEKLLTVIEQKIHLLFRQFYEKLSVESTIGTEFACLLGGTPKTNIPDFWNGDINWINSGEVNKLRVTQASKKITRLGMEKSATKLLPKGTTVIAITGATLGQVSLLEIDTCANQSVIGVLCNRFGKDFIYPLICYHITDLIGKQTGGAQQHINMNDVKSLSIKIPTEQEYCIYSKKVLPLFEKQSNLCLEITKLNELKQLYLKKFFG